MLNDGAVLALLTVGALAVGSTVARGPRGSGYRGKLMVPADIPKTPRSAATGRYVFPKTRDFPIGDLYHARLALIYAMAPSHESRRAQVLRAVKQAYPQYDWQAWWTEHMATKGGSSNTDARLQAWMNRMLAELRRHGGDYEARPYGWWEEVYDLGYTPQQAVKQSMQPWDPDKWKGDWTAMPPGRRR